MFQGKLSLSDSNSFRLKESCEHWRREIRQAYETGKTVIVFLTTLEEVYVDTGQRSYSGHIGAGETARHDVGSAGVRGRKKRMPSCNGADTG
ncbi:MAG: hypothetical protein RBR35_16125 [Salinivirgaceae bacterium]|nr:hypothetical protein [Salinivirgaceae bacterium]